MSKIKLESASIVTAFNTHNVIGTKVTHREKFLAHLESAVEQYDFPGYDKPWDEEGPARIRGQGFVHLGNDVDDYIISGIGRSVPNISAYHVMHYRGKCEAYLIRERAAKVSGCACIVHTTEAYAANAEVTPSEALRVRERGATHVIVATLAFAGPPTPTHPRRMVPNLAGGNEEAMAWTKEEIHEKCAESDSFWREWSVVADRSFDE